MSEKHPLSILPSDAPSNVTARKMTEAFHESGSEDLLLVVLTDDNGLSPADEATYRTLVDTLRKDTGNVVMLQDFISTPPLKSIVTSKDDKAWVLPVGVAGELGTPRSYEAFNADHRRRHTHRRGKLVDGQRHRSRRNRRRPHRRRSTRTGCRSSWPSVSWCSSFC